MRIAPRSIVRPLTIGLLGAFALSSCDCGDTLGALPEPKAVLVHDEEESPPLERLEVGVGTVDLAQVASAVIAVRNDGTRELQVDSILLAGDAELCPSPSPDFSIARPPVRTFEVAPLEATEIEVVFQPSTGSPACAVLEVRSDDEQHPVLKALITGQGDAAQLCTDRNVIDFGEVVVGETATDVVTLTSCGTRALTLDDMDENQFFPPFGSTMPAFPLTLEPGASVDIPVRFSPTEATVYSLSTGNAGILSVDSDDLSALYQIALEGSSRLPPSCGIQVAPSVMNFGGTFVGVPKTQQLAVRNVGDLVCNLESIVVRAPAGSFSVDVGTLTLPGVLEPLATAYVEVTFAPASATGQEATFLDIKSDDLARPTVEVPLQGVGLAAPPCLIEATPDPVSFGTQGLGEPATRPVSLKNVGTEQCRVSKINLSSDTSPAFFISSLPPPNFLDFVNIGVGETVIAEVKFTPTVADPVTGTLQIFVVEGLSSILNQDPTFTVQLTGQGSGPRLCVEPDPILFGSHPAGTSTARDVDVINCGSTDLDVTGVGLGAGTSSEFAITGGDTSGTIPPGGSLTVTITYTGVDDGADQGVLVVTSNDPISPATDVDMYAGTGLCGDIYGLACGLTGGPLVGGTVSVSVGGEQISTTTNGDGEYVLSCVPAGSHTVVIESGNWSAEVPVTVQNQQTSVLAERCLDPTSARIAVAQGEWDSMESTLDALDIDYDFYTYDPESFTGSVYQLVNDPSVMNQYDIIFFNCGTDELDIIEPNSISLLRDFVAQGGSFYTSDWAYDIVERGWPTAVDFWGDDSATDTAQGAGGFNGPATILDEGLSAHLGGVSQIPIHSCCVAMDSLGPGSTAYLEGDRYGDGVMHPLLMGHQPTPDAGRVFYSDFHTSEQDDITGIFAWVLEQL